jgi:hypothetical protein
MPSLPADGQRKPNDAEQAEFERQLEILVKQHKNYPSIVTWVRSRILQCFADMLTIIGHL